MNKYLDDYYRVNGELAKKYKTNAIWDNIPKLVIASELENILEDWGDFESVKLNDNEQERLINLIYNFIVNLEEDIGEFTATKAVAYTLLEDYNGNFADFTNDCEHDYTKVHDLFVWRL